MSLLFKYLIFRPNLLLNYDPEQIHFTRQIIKTSILLFMQYFYHRIYIQIIVSNIENELSYLLICVQFKSIFPFFRTQNVYMFVFHFGIGIQANCIHLSFCYCLTLTTRSRSKKLLQIQVCNLELEITGHSMEESVMSLSSHSILIGVDDSMINVF